MHWIGDSLEQLSLDRLSTAKQQYQGIEWRGEL